MKANDFRKLKKNDVAKKINDFEEEYLQLRCKHGIGMLENTSLLKKKRKEIVIGKTILSQMN